MPNNSFTPAELNDGFVVAIQIEANDGEEQAVAEGLRLMVEPTMAEPKVKLFIPYRSPENSKSFFIYELYTSEEGWAEHQQTEHFKNFVETVLPHIANRQRVQFVPFVDNLS